MIRKRIDCLRAAATFFLPEPTMQDIGVIAKRALLSGTVASVTTTLAASFAGKREAGAYAAPLNATSHIVWGDEAARQDRPSLKYTVTGVVLNHAAAVMWAAAYEKWLASSSTGVQWPRSVVKLSTGAAAVSAGAYV